MCLLFSHNSFSAFFCFYLVVLILFSLDEYAAQHNYYTNHLAKILIHLVWSLEDLLHQSSRPLTSYRKSVNAAYVSSVFLKFIIENAKGKNFEELCLNLDQDEKKQNNLPTGMVLVVPYLLFRNYQLLW